MTSPRDILIKDYWYNLPDEKIAWFPLENRDQSKLLVYKKGNIPTEYTFKDLPDLLPDDSLLILNDTRVIHARLLFRKPSGANIEIFCLNPVHPVRELQQAFAMHSPVIWECLVGNARRWKEGNLSLQLENPEGTVTLVAERLTTQEVEKLRYPLANTQLIRLSWTPAETNLSSIIEKFGIVPLPPYIHRESLESDKTRYQTVYARQEGSVAAPTAGLHFTPALFNSLKSRGINCSYLTLHVGAGTFKPVTTEKIGDHTMHAEPFEVSVDLLEELLTKVNRRFIAVGTTSVRTLESLYFVASRLIQSEIFIEDFVIQQWEPYDNVNSPGITKTEVLKTLISYLKKHGKSTLKGHTQLMIAPGYRFHLVDGMVTNFHQPGSTLLLLIAAFLGDEWKNIYEFALKHQFRFLSYGDSCLFM